MSRICLYFQIHQPFRLRHYSVAAIGTHASYFDEGLNESIFRQATERCYEPAARLFLRLLNECPGLHLGFSFSGVWLEQCAIYAPDCLDLYKKLVAQKERVDVLGETSHHSLAALVDEREFFSQVDLHRALIGEHLGREVGSVFRNTELIYSNAIGRLVSSLGFSGVLREGGIGLSQSEQAFCHPDNPRLVLLSRDFEASDDIGFRFFDRKWATGRLTVHDFLRRLLGRGREQLIPIFMDLETFGEHVNATSGIWEFLEEWVLRVDNHPKLSFVTPSQAVEEAQTRSLAILSHDEAQSWADEARDVSTWLGNELQRDAHDKVWRLAPLVRKLGQGEGLTIWRRLLTSDHFYYMSSKGDADGAVHAYFRPYFSSFEAYINYMNILEDFEGSQLHQGEMSTDTN